MSPFMIPKMMCPTMMSLFAILRSVTVKLYCPDLIKHLQGQVS
jgi:hypothetical protein